MVGDEYSKYMNALHQTTQKLMELGRKAD